jgi:hypothetical protein
MRYATVGLMTAILVGCGSNGSNVARRGSATGGLTNPVCVAGASAGAVQAPVFVRNIRGQTGWYASPVVADLDHDGSNEIVAAYYTLYVYDATGKLLDSAEGNGSRIYAPHVVTDLEGDGITEIVVGQGHEVYAYEWRDRSLHLKWVASTETAGEKPEVRGMAAADLDGDGNIEVVVTTTQTQSASDGGAQVFVFDSSGHLFQPVDTPYPAWPRYNDRTGAGGDADRNGQGHDGYGCYGLNVGIGNMDDDPDLEIVVTYDNHEIQLFKKDGVAVDASPWFTNPSSEYLGRRLTWGQFIRWADPAVEEAHYHLHTGEWPNPGNGQEWLQWTASPPNVVDLNGDGQNEVVGVPNVEKDDPYVTQAYAIMVLQGDYGDGSRSAMRLPGWETLPRGETPVYVDGWYPPGGVPAAATVDIQGDARPEIVVSLNDEHMHAYDAGGQELWYRDYGHGKPIMYASEPAVADLNQDGSPEIVFTTYGDPNSSDSGHLMILSADGELLHDVALPNPGHNGNGNGAPSAPTIADVDGDGQLEILVQTFDHGMDVFTVPGSGTGCVLWGTARGGPLRMGAPNGG